MTNLAHIESLARDYKQRAETSGKWTDYVKAHGLANFCVVKDSTEDRRKLVYNIEESWYKGSHPLIYEDYQQLIKDHKSLLNSYRENTKREYELLERHVNCFDRKDILSRRNFEVAETFADLVFEASKQCSAGSKQFSQELINSSVKILTKAPCKFAVIGLGSLAKGEATPYSDLEYAFIVEHSDEYFEKLAVDSYFRIGNLGETPLEYFDIAELTSETGESNTPIIAKEIPAGYRIDGLKEKAGNIPTGNGREGSQRLTLTVDEFIELYKSEAVSPFDQNKPGDLSDLLSSSVVIYTNEGKESLLHEEFDRKRQEFESFNSQNSIDIYTKRYQTLVTDIQSGSFSSSFIKFQPPKNFGIKLKRDIFRYPTLLAINVKMLLGLNARYSWEIFSHLHTQRFLSQENYRSIKTVLALAIYVRTREYIHNKAQIDHFSVIPTTEESPDTSMQGTVFVFFGCLLDSLKQSVNRNVESGSAGELLPQRVVMSIFQNLSLQKDSLQIAEVCYYAGQYNMAKHELGKGLGFSFEEKAFGYVLHTLHQMYSNKKEAEKYLELCCYILYHTKHYSAADSYFQWLIRNETKKEMPNADVRLWTLLRAHCKKEQFLYQETRDLVDEAMRGQDRPPESDANHPDECDNYINIAIMLESLSEYEAAKRYLKQAQDIAITVYDEKGTTADKQKKNKDIDKATAQRSQIYNLFGVIYNRLGNYSKSLKWCEESLSMNKRIFGEDAQIPEIAHSYNTIGHTYGFLGKYDSSLEYHQKSLAMRKAIYGETTDHPETAHSYNNIGHDCGRLAKYDLSLENLEKGLKMRKMVHEATPNHPHIANSYHNIGNTYSWKGSYDLALEYHTKALDMRLAIYGGTADNKHIADSYDYAGRQHHILGNFTKALEFQSKSLHIRKNIHSNKPNHPEIATNYDYIGKVHKVFGNYPQSLKLHNEALKMRKSIHGENTNHPHIATGYINIGSTYLCQGNYSFALKYFTKALDMRKAVHGSSTYHPDITMSYDYVGRAHIGLRDYSTALKCLKKSLEMRTNEPRGAVSDHYFAHSYESMGAAHFGLQNYTRSLDFYYKSLEKRTIFFGNSGKHPDIAFSYRGIANAYSQLHDYELALEYHTKALDMLKEIYYDATNHRELVQSYQDVAQASESLKVVLGGQFSD